MKHRYFQSPQAAALYACVFLSIFFTATLPSAGQISKPVEHFALHPRAGLLSNFYTADFRSFQGAVDCGVFSDGDGTGLSAFLTGELPLSDNLLLGLGIGFADRSGLLSAANGFPSRDTVTGDVVDVHTLNELDATLQYLEFQPEIRLVAIEDFIRGPLRLMSGLRFAIPLTTEFAQTEAIQSPDNATFTQDGLRTQTRSIAAGDITTRNSLGFGVSLGVENMLAIGSKTHFTQQVVFDYFFSDIAEDVDWTPFALRFEAGLRFSFSDDPELPPPPPPVEEQPEVQEPVVQKPVEKPPVVIAPPDPEALVVIENIDTQMQVGNELLALASLSLVNAVFFERNSADIPNKYLQQTTNRQPFDALESHRHILLDIAKTVAKNPGATITLYGATSGEEDETGGKTLAQNRAEAVKQALVQLGVPERIFSVRSTVLPRNPSNQDYPEGREENRRVDVIVKNAPLQEYVNKQRFAQLTGAMTTRVKLQHLPEGVNATLTGNMSKEPQRISASQSQATMPILMRLNPDGAQTSVTASVELAANDGSAKATDSRSITLSNLPVEQIDLKLSDFQPILRFDYNSSVLSETNKELLRQMIGALPDGAKITISGSADALGSEQRNLELSQKRAKNVERYLRSIAGNRFSIASQRKNLRFPEDTPEGRFLNRSIRVQVEE